MTASDLRRALREWGYLPWTPATPDKPDSPTLDVDPVTLGPEPDGDTPDMRTVTMLCANQCARDKGHPCGVRLTIDTLQTRNWPQDVAAVVPWMIVSWGPHYHQLPFCCTGCLQEFVAQRATYSQVLADHQH